MNATPWVVFAIASAAVFPVSVDATIAVAALPALRSSLTGTSPATLSPVLNACTLLYAALLVPAGRLVDLHGAKRLYLFGVAPFTLAAEEHAGQGSPDDPSQGWTGGFVSLRPLRQGSPRRPIAP